MTLNDVNISQKDVDDLMQDIDGPVGDMMRQIAEDIASVARGTAPVRKPGSTWSRRSSAKPPGYTKNLITTTVGHSKLNNDYVFGGANAPEDPTIFLEYPAEQMHHKIPFLTDALDSVFL